MERVGVYHHARGGRAEAEMEAERRDSGARGLTPHYRGAHAFQRSGGFAGAPDYVQGSNVGLTRNSTALSRTSLLSLLQPTHVGSRSCA